LSFSDVKNPFFKTMCVLTKSKSLDLATKMAFNFNVCQIELNVKNNLI